MEVITSIQEIQELALRLEKDGKKIGFVPTMGYLHDGHLSSIDLIRKRFDVPILSIFVNPIQFGVGEDGQISPRYGTGPRPCKERKVDYIFAPQTDAINPKTSTMCQRKVLQGHGEARLSLQGNHFV